jgi:hypothetical protein
MAICHSLFAIRYMLCAMLKYRFAMRHSPKEQYV